VTSARIISEKFTGFDAWPFGSRRLCVPCAWAYSRQPTTQPALLITTDAVTEYTDGATLANVLTVGELPSTCGGAAHGPAPAHPADRAVGPPRHRRSDPSLGRGRRGEAGRSGLAADHGGSDLAPTEPPGTTVEAAHRPTSRKLVADPRRVVAAATLAHRSSAVGRRPSPDHHDCTSRQRVDAQVVIAGRGTLGRYADAHDSGRVAGGSLTLRRPQIRT
jgi:hypothetical protein